MNVSKTIIAFFLLVTSTLANCALITTYTDRNIFNSNVGNTSLETFGTPTNFISNIPNGILNSFTNYQSVLPGDIAVGATYSTPTHTGGSLNIDSSISASNGFEGGFLDGGFLTDTALTITYNPLVASFGFETNGSMSQFFLTINFVSGSSYQKSFFLDPNDGSLKFFGFQSDAIDIESINISSNSNFSFAIDNHSFGGIPTSAVVPVPSALLLFISGLLGLVFAHKNHA